MSDGNNYFNITLLSPKLNVGYGTRQLQDGENSSADVKGSNVAVQDAGILWNAQPIDWYAAFYAQTKFQNEDDSNIPSTNYNYSLKEYNALVVMPGYVTNFLFCGNHPLTDLGIKFTYFEEENKINYSNDLPNDPTKATPNAWQPEFSFKGQRLMIRQTVVGPLILTGGYESKTGTFSEIRGYYYAGKSDKGIATLDYIGNLGDNDGKLWLHGIFTAMGGTWQQTSIATVDKDQAANQTFDVQTPNYSVEGKLKVEWNGCTELGFDSGIRGEVFGKIDKYMTFAPTSTFGGQVGIFGFANISLKQVTNLYPRKEFIDAKDDVKWVLNPTLNLPIVGANSLFGKNSSFDVSAYASYTAQYDNSLFGSNDKDDLMVGARVNIDPSSLPVIGNFFSKKPTKKDLINIMKTNHSSKTVAMGVFAPESLINAKIENTQNEFEKSVEEGKGKEDHTFKTRPSKNDIAKMTAASASATTTPTPVVTPVETPVETPTVEVK